MLRGVLRKPYTHKFTTSSITTISCIPIEFTKTHSKIVLVVAKTNFSFISNQISKIIESISAYLTSLNWNMADGYFSTIYLRNTYFY